jgi:alpha-glucosidase (family GH31 glycosyl hydrolase)
MQWLIEIRTFTGFWLTPLLCNQLLPGFSSGLRAGFFGQHGARIVEPWVLQKCENRTYHAVAKVIKARYALRPYVMQLMRSLHTTGAPINRPLSYDFEADDAAWFVADQFMFGPKYMSAPISGYNTYCRSAYFPSAATRCSGGWKHHFTGKSYKADGHTEVVDAPYDELPLFECIV